jgi:toxin YoeB
MIYSLQFTDNAKEDLARLQKNEPSAYKKAEILLKELRTNPKVGTGKPNPLGANRSGQWSRRITDKHRLVYSVDDGKVLVYVIAALGHYADK